MSRSKFLREKYLVWVLFHYQLVFVLVLLLGCDISFITGEYLTYNNLRWSDIWIYLSNEPTFHTLLCVVFKLIGEVDLVSDSWFLKHDLNKENVRSATVLWNLILNHVSFAWGGYSLLWQPISSFSLHINTYTYEKRSNKKTFINIACKHVGTSSFLTHIIHIWIIKSEDLFEKICGTCYTGSLAKLMDMKIPQI